MNSLQQDYEQELQASLLKDLSRECGGEHSQNIVSNPSYMLLQSTSEYSNLPKTPTQLEVVEPEGYLKMSPVMPKAVRPSTHDSKAPSIDV
jgi:hypothetical protein